MISLNWFSYRAQIDSLMDRYRELPGHVARKHLKAAMKRTVKGGIPVLKKLTPKGAGRNTIEKGSGQKIRVRAGALRRAVTAKSAWVGKRKDGFVVGVVGYRYGLESRKAIWLDQGTVHISPRKIMKKFRAAYKRPAGWLLVKEMKKAFEAAGRELASGKNSNPNYRRS